LAIRRKKRDDDMSKEWGPLGPLVGEWEGEGGLDASYSHAKGEVVGTPYREKVTFRPFGPVDNGSQHLYGLDYKTAMWRNDEDNPFHTEVGYWLWDDATGEVLRAVAIPRGITVLAGGHADTDAREFTLKAAVGDAQYPIGEGNYLTTNASSVTFETTITLVGDDTWSYAETTMLRMKEFPDLLPHTDHNTMHRVG
jgi:hypothetical protein